MWYTVAKLENLGKVNLFTRPRRFGKPLNMSRLKYFFEIGSESALFDGLEISIETELCSIWTKNYQRVSLQDSTISMYTQ